MGLEMNLFERRSLAATGHASDVAAGATGAASSASSSIPAMPVVRSLESEFDDGNGTAAASCKKDKKLEINLYDIQPCFLCSASSSPH